MRHKQWNRWLTMTLIVLWIFPPVSAEPINNVYEMCLDGLTSINPDHVWIPVGCDLPDCCSGCSASPLDWHIRLTGDSAESVVLRFENLPKDTASKLVVEGNGQWDGNSLRVRQGETILRGFVVDPQAPVIPDAIPPPVAIPQINLKRQGVAEGATIELKVEQFIGLVQVNESRLFYQFKSCTSSIPTNEARPDTIFLRNNNDADNAVLLFDGRLSIGCTSYKVFRGINSISFENILSNGVCASEVVVFSDNNAMALVMGITAWTDRTGNNLTVDLSPTLTVPVTVWLARSGARAQAEADIALANLLFNSNNVGIAFSAGYRDIPTNIGRDNCGDLQVIKNKNFYHPNQLNVYYVDNTDRGENCSGEKEPNFQFIGRGSNTQSLTHEFGHSFSLVPADQGGHVNELSGFGTNNIMWGGGSNRTDFSLGQAFRMNVNTDSTLILNRHRESTEPPRTCKPLDEGPTCPRLALDAFPK